MAVMARAQKRTDTADYTAMDEATQEHFDCVMEYADNTRHPGKYTAFLLAAAALSGLPADWGTEIRRCACSCYCEVIFDSADPDAHVIEQSGSDFNLGRHQCPTCADHHRETA